MLHLITCHGRIMPRLAELLLFFCCCGFFWGCFFFFFFKFKIKGFLSVFQITAVVNFAMSVYFSK